MSSASCFDFMIALVCRARNVSADDILLRNLLSKQERALLSKQARAPENFARQICIYLAHTELGLSLVRAGACFGCDRKTAVEACRVVEDARDDHWLDIELDCLGAALKAYAEHTTQAEHSANAEHSA